MNRVVPAAVAALAVAMLTACASKMENGYGIGIQAERQAALDQAMKKDAPPDTPGMYLALIDRMQAQGLWFASLAHIDAYEQQYGESPDTILLRADALRQTGQHDASTAAYMRLVETPLAARAWRGLGLLAGARGDFAEASLRFETAVKHAPTDAPMLSDLGYALMRSGDIAAARVPLLKSAELSPGNPKIMSNVALYFLASGQLATAQALIAQQKFAPDVQQAIRGDAARIAQAAKAHGMDRTASR